MPQKINALHSKSQFIICDISYQEKSFSDLITKKMKHKKNIALEIFDGNYFQLTN